ncbi:MAG: succinylglutamate desuccinylase [Rhizobiales bacterium]|nr:succinylglutamate desuccinylase [Hyphomicrobiales bacterium]
MPESAPVSRLTSTIDLSAPGKRFGELCLRWSDNAQPLGYHAIPVVAIVGKPGPSALLVAGVHGDEFEGPAALMRLAHALEPDEVDGRIVILPALNMPAVERSSRVSPLDGVNLNRAFPGDRDGGPSAMLAHYVEAVLMPGCDLVVDLHSGGKASVFTPCALAARDGDRLLEARNFALARAFGAQTVWVLGGFNDNRSVNAAAARCKVPMIAAELGGGGGCEPALVALAEVGVRRCLAAVGILADAPAPPDWTTGRPRPVEIRSLSQNVYAPLNGVFERAFAAGDEVEAGDVAGRLYLLDEPGRVPIELRFPVSGLVLAHGNRGHAMRGDMLAMVAADATDVELGGAS